MASEIGSIQPNPYLFKIESRRKQKARLAHEIGAGAKCIKCKEKCSGFQLHYWRKLCLNCRCSKDEHEIDEEDDDIGRVVIGKLFDRPIRTLEEEEEYSHDGRFRRSVGRATFLRVMRCRQCVEQVLGIPFTLCRINLELVNSDTGKKEDYVFDWIPPGVTKDLVTRYMQMLPKEKWPVTGSTAARNRRKQLEQQLPLYDMDENERCENMLPEEMQNFQKHLENLRSKVAGQASVIEVHIDIMQDNPAPPRNYQDQDTCMNNNRRPISPLKNNNTSSPGYRSLSAYPKGILELEEMVNSLDMSPKLSRASNHNWSQTDENVRQPVEGSIRNLRSPRSDMQRSQKVPPQLAPSHALPLQKTHSTSTANSESEPIYANLNEVMSDSDLGVRNNHSQKTDGTQLAANDSQLLNLSGEESSMLYTTALQAPYSPHKDIWKGTEMRATADNVNILLPQENSTIGGQKEAPQEAFKCQQCQDVMPPGDVAVICEKAGPDKFWHPNCFVCATCNELLADLIYFYKDGKVYCGRDYHVVSNIPRCHACDELIFSDTWTRADGFDWHIHHYCCFICDHPLAGNKYIPDGRGYPHCISCYMAFMAKMCETCEQRISPDQTRAGYNGYYYHALPQCFCCHRCQESLLGRKFKMAKNWVFCSQDCMVDCAEEISCNANEVRKPE